MTTPGRKKKITSLDTAREASFAQGGRGYSALLRDLKAGIGAQRDWLVNLAITVSVIAERVPDLIGTGFYVWRNGRLEKGPFNGEATQSVVSNGYGILGSVISLRDPVLVGDLRKLTGQSYTGSVISKLALPLLVDERLVGVLDLDSETPGRFAEKDRDGLSRLIYYLVMATDWPAEAGCDAMPVRAIRF